MKMVSLLCVMCCPSRGLLLDSEPSDDSCHVTIYSSFFQGTFGCNNEKTAEMKRPEDMDQMKFGNELCNGKESCELYSCNQFWKNSGSPTPYDCPENESPPMMWVGFKYVSMSS